MTDFNDYRVIDRALILSELTDEADILVDRAISHAIDGDDRLATAMLAQAAGVQLAREELAIATKHAPALPEGWSYDFEQGWVQA